MLATIWATRVGRVEKNESCCVRYPADGVGSGQGGNGEEMREKRTSGWILIEGRRHGKVGGKVDGKVDGVVSHVCSISWCHTWQDIGKNMKHGGDDEGGMWSMRRRGRRERREERDM